MTSRRRAQPPPDLQTLKRSRKSFTGAITKTRDKLLLMKDGDIGTYQTKSIDRILTSVTHTEEGFLQTIDDAQDFLTEEEESSALQKEEDEAMDNFSTAITEVRDTAEELLNLKSLHTGIADLTRDLQTLKDVFNGQPEANHTSAMLELETAYASLRLEWKKSDLNPTHPLKATLDNFKAPLIQLKAELATERDKSAPTPSSTSASTCCRGSSTSEKGKLPDIALPTFYGNIMEWASFWTAFSAAIDKREDLSDTTKLIYLRQAIKDPECQTLLYSPNETPGMYKEVVAELQARFSRTKEIHRNLVQQILQMTAVKQTRIDLRRLVDNCRATIFSLKRTGHYDLDAFLTSVIYLLLPTRLQTSWEQHTKKDKGVAPVADLLTYLSEHSDTLPSTPHNSGKPSEVPEKKNFKKQEKKQDHNPHRQKASVHVVTPSPTYRWECALCRPDKHPLFLCSKWQAYTVDQRLSHIQAKKLCHNCLAVGHATNACKSTYKCRVWTEPPHHNSSGCCPSHSNAYRLCGLRQ